MCHNILHSTQFPAVALAALMLNARDFGAVGDGVARETQALQRGIDACAQAGGGTLVCPPGVYSTGQLVLRSRVTLHLERGATLRGSANIADYPILHRGSPVGLIYAEQAEGAAITGPGCIDGNGEAFWRKRETPHDWAEAKKSMGTWIPHFDYDPLHRPRALILFVKCRDSRIENVRITNSLHWTLLMVACDGAVLRNITMRTPLYGPNTDGIDLDACRDVLVDGCDIFTGDDAIALKNKNEWGIKRPSRRITVRNCLLRSATHGFTIGTETQDDFEEITFVDSEIRSPSGKVRTLTGIGLSILDGAAIRQVHVARIRMSGVVAPIQIRLGNAARGQEKPRPGRIADLRLEDVEIRDASGVCLVAGLPGHPLEGIVLRNITVDRSGRLRKGQIMPDVPELESEYPLNAVWRFLPAQGFYLRHARSVAMDRIAIRGSHADARPAFLAEDVIGLEAGGLSFNGEACPVYDTTSQK